MTYEEPQQSPPYNPVPERPARNWDASSVDKGKIAVWLVLIAVALVLVFAVTMCAREDGALPPAQSERMGDAGGEGILQRNVDAAFDMPTPHNPQSTRETRMEASGDALPPPAPPASAAMNNGGAQIPSANTPREQTLEEAQMQQLQEEQRVLAEREKLLQQQRDAVPSLLPENPPRPAKLGAY